MTTVFPTATITGYPRIGARRELKRAVEAYWAGKSDQNELKQTAQKIQQDAYRALTERGLTNDYAIPADFSFYDQVLDTTRLFTALPARFESVRDDRGLINLDGYFALARGTEHLPPLELTKWFDTNYHYLVPEIGPTTGFTLNTEALDDLLAAAEAAGTSARPSITGPLTYLLLAKAEDGTPADFAPLDRLADLLPLYRDLLAHLAGRGVLWVQFNEPALGADQAVSEAELAQLIEKTYGELTQLSDRPSLLVTSPYGNLAGLLEPLATSGVEALHLDLVSTGYDQDALARLFGGDSAPLLVAGVVNGRNIWRNDLAASLHTLQAVGAASVSTSTSLQHVPYDLDLETGLDQKLTSWLAFAHQKVSEVALLARGLAEGPETIASEVEQAKAALAARAQSSGVNDPCIRERALSITPENYERPSAQVRQQAQEDLNLPLLPTTTIGSFPQTGHIRSLRADYHKGALTREELDAHLREEIRCVIDFQERLGLDVLVHGEAERNDMVQYFAENFDGFAPTEHGWVQSYGSRCTRPSILWGDVKRSGAGTRGEAFTVPWISFAQQQTDKPVKGMLTGPVTILAWSFVRDDQPLAATATQVALALADEIADLEAAGTRIIQVDEPALRELLPLRTEEQAAYLDWSVGAFRLATSQVADSTQIHTHLCYSEFNEIFGAIDALNADVTSIEAARSRLELLADVPESFDRGIGPGVWDIHSPRVPQVDEVEKLLTTALEHIPARQLWVNPDCGLKTRAYKETKASIESLVAATEAVRASLNVAV
ncbi:5-methyltetrahydropteroyltriglutamate--homocysteine S-methyltransferase [Rothia nasimurium]|uniref:5-methyltetrahydropteroyltriglutamate--homocysteine S-methyltransferase n=1 Tax=Rothia nasimurium TaxID=85336 RepID=A0A4Y9F2D7_9MICC|nr:5-methyltetrahydropteroyltriglutamate--homocysteine S-methyltransferase [Rothia nasimurium]MBF0809102.1 5-methyltetrahydropteroyltriglutamate--homocysteine S-methyltransferase [Rothia nasimurium]TFU20666.1 5-methyltetrahydropteroyltriglutamate--homocysteine S-methyltransferase [Rothia nasimurium]